ncbi:hypothetical protein G4B88_022498 [Cannabis sativa]|uniref:Uncharacterized protein n=1 Tax=Cannabis sativa TaxID=3483 RepID=A0A7J6G8U5_CANSA|nr:hypothetical protein G4B88_024839 [Cannabis sativa]KAF4399415.1 hypothetical protein G4B88_022498 [Cannabis sativa]
MKALSRFLAAFALTVSLILSSWSCEARVISKLHPSSPSSSTQAVKDLQINRTTPYQQVKSNFRRIPRSGIVLHKMA